MNGVWLILRRSIRLVVNKVIRSNHLDIRVFNVDAARPPKSDSHRSISCEQGPPNPLPQAFVRSAELRMLNAAVHQHELRNR